MSLIIADTIAHDHGSFLEIELLASTGLTGRGSVNAEELDHADVQSAIRACLGLDVFALKDLAQVVEPQIAPRVFGAVETAFYDLQARGRGQSLARMLGGEVQPSIEVGLRADLRDVVRPIASLDDLATAINEQSVDAWIVDPIQLGGPTRFLRGLALARTFLIDVAIDARDHGPIGEALALHLAASSRLVNGGIVLKSGERRGRSLPPGNGLGS